MTVGASFSVMVEETADVAILRLSGEVNRSAAPRLFEAFREACGKGVERVALDFADVAYLNSTGIALIVGILTEARKAGVPILGWGLSDHFREIFEITRLVEYISLHEDKSEALATG